MYNLNQHDKHLARLSSGLAQFLKDRTPINIDDKNLDRTYRQSTEYLSYTTIFHGALDVKTFIVDFINQIRPADTITDIGCHSGFTGLSAVLAGRSRVTFHDYDGLALDFIRWFAKENDLSSVEIVPYGLDPAPARWVLALDVLEHTGNQLAALQWLEKLSQDYVVMTYPLLAYHPPYFRNIDEYVDDEAIQMIIADRCHIIKSYIADSRRYMIYEV